MTCIVAVRKDDHVLIAADSQSTEGRMAGLHSIDKIVDVGNNANPIYVGCTGYARTIAELRKNFVPPVRVHGHNHLESVCWSIVIFVRELPKIDDDKHLEGSFIVVSGNEIYTIDTGGGPFRVDADFYVEGSGREVACGAMYVEKDPRKAVEAANKYITSCGGEIIVKSTKASSPPRPKRK